MAALPPEAGVRIGTATGSGSERGAEVIRRAREALREPKPV